MFPVYYIHTEILYNNDILVHSEKSSFAACDWTTFSRVKSIVRGLSLARTHLRTKFCDMALSWVWLSIYIIKHIFIFAAIIYEAQAALYDILSLQITRQPSQHFLIRKTGRLLRSLRICANTTRRYIVLARGVVKPRAILSYSLPFPVNQHSAKYIDISVTPSLIRIILFHARGGTMAEAQL